MNTMMPSHIKTNDRSSRDVAVVGRIVMPIAQWMPLKNLASLWKIRSSRPRVSERPCLSSLVASVFCSREFTCFVHVNRSKCFFPLTRANGTTRRQVSDRATAGTRRHGRGLSRDTPVTETHGRDQGHSSGYSLGFSTLPPRCLPRNSSIAR